MARWKETASTGTLVSDADMKAYLRIDTSASDALIASLVKAAVGYIEGQLLYLFLERTVTFTIRGWPIGRIVWLPVGPAVSITKVEAQNLAGAWEDTEAAVMLCWRNAFVWGMELQAGEQWPESAFPDDDYQAIRVVYKAGLGLGDASVRMIQAVKQLTAHWFTNPEAVLAGEEGLNVKEIPQHFQSVLNAIQREL